MLKKGYRGQGMGELFRTLKSDPKLGIVGASASRQADGSLFRSSGDSHIWGTHNYAPSV